MKIRTYLVALAALAFSSTARADEGMWLLQLMKQQNCIRLFLIKELLYCILVGQVEFFVRTTYQVVITSLLEVIPDSRTHESVVSCYINFRIF